MGKVTIIVEDESVATAELYRMCLKATDAEDFNYELPDEAEVCVVPSEEE